MKRPLPLTAILLAAGLTLLAACQDNPVAGDRTENGLETAADKSHKLPASLDDQVNSLRADLEKQGYAVAQGYWTLFDIEDCKFPIKTVGNCYGNNPTAPYVMAAVPPWKDEFVDQKLHHAFTALQRNASVTFRLDEREALVVFGQLPPPAAYLGLQTYAYSREGTIPVDDPLYKSPLLEDFMRKLLFAISPNPDRVLVFSSLGNSINHAVIERQSGSSFGQNRSFVVTPDAAMDRAVREALLRTAVSDPSHTFTEPIPKDLLRLGLGRSADDFMTLIRFAMPVDEAAADLWRANIPLAILRVRDMNTARPTEPYPIAPYDARDASSELGLAGDLSALVSAVKESRNQPDATVLPFNSAYQMLDLVGQHCLARPMNCLGETQDTDTYRLRSGLTIDNGEVIGVVGTLATATGNASYVSLAINRMEVLQGVANLSHHDLAGTAAAFADAVDDPAKFYVTYVSRDCTGYSPCMELPERLIPSGEHLTLVQRNYLRPSTVRGADPMQLLNPRVIVFHHGS